MQNDLGKFHVNSFQNNITMQMNARMAIKFCCLVKNTAEVDRELFAAMEKVRTQLYHMKMIHLLDLELSKGVILNLTNKEDSDGNTHDTGKQSDACGGSACQSDGDGGQCDVGASEAA